VSEIISAISTLYSVFIYFPEGPTFCSMGWLMKLDGVSRRQRKKNEDIVS